MSNQSNQPRIDLDKYDVQILLGCDPTRGVWVNETTVAGRNRSRPIRTAGQLPTEASAHTLHVAALISALRNITRNKAFEIVNTAKAAISKPRVQVVIVDPTFGEALQAKMKGEAGKPLRVSQQFLIELARQLARFTLSFSTEADNGRVLSLKNWGVKTIHDPKVIERVPPALAPTVASVMI